MPASARIRRPVVGIAALLGFLIGSYFLWPDAKLTPLTGIACPPALLVFPAYLELEMRFAGIRHSQIALRLMVLLVMLLNAALYAAITMAIRGRRTSLRQ